MTRWSCGRLAEADPHGHRTTSQLPTCAATGEAVGTCGHAADRVGVLPTWTRADAVNERLHDGGCHCHMARCRSLGRLPVTNRVSNFSHYALIRVGNVTCSLDGLGYLPGYSPGPGRCRSALRRATRRARHLVAMTWAL